MMCSTGNLLHDVVTLSDWFPTFRGDCFAFIFRVKQCNFFGLNDPEDKLLTQRLIDTNQKT
jgi:hypothetical protein